MTDKDTVVETLIDLWAAIDSLVCELDDDQWAAASPCPGWTVHDLIAHIVGTERSLAGHTPPESDTDFDALAHVHNKIGVLNETWVQAFSRLSSTEMMEQFRATTAERASALRAMTAEDFAAPSWTPAGQSTYGRFMRIRVFDCWMHEQDIRDTLALPGGMDCSAADLAVDEIIASLGYIVSKLGKAPDGTSVTFDLTGVRPRRIHVSVDGRAQVVDELPGPATVTIELPTGLFTRLCGGRVDYDLAIEKVKFVGDEPLGRQLTTALAYTI